MILNKGNVLKENATKTPTHEDIKWLENWLNLSKESYLKGWEDGHAYIVFGAKSNLNDEAFQPDCDWGIVNALLSRGFKYKLEQGDYTYKTVGTFNPNSMQSHNRGFDRTLKNRVRLDIYWKNNENLEEVKNMNKNLTEAVDKGQLVDFIKKSVEDLKSGGIGTHFFDLGLPNQLHLVIGVDGEGDTCAKLAVNIDDLQYDYDWDWYRPYDRETGEVCDCEIYDITEMTPDEIADESLRMLDSVKDLDIDEDGAIIEHEEVVEEAVEKKDCDCKDNKCEDCEKKPLKEAMDPIKQVVYDYMSEDGGVVPDGMFDLLCNLVGRVDDYTDEDDIYRAVDDGMIYTDDQWTAYRFYCDMGDPVDQMWEGLTNDVYNICARLAGSHNDDIEIEDDEEVEEGVKTPITESDDLKVKDVLDVELQDDDTETGGVSFTGEKVKDIVDEFELDIEAPIDELNDVLREIGIKPIKK